MKKAKPIKVAVKIPGTSDPFIFEFKYKKDARGFIKGVRKEYPSCEVITTLPDVMPRKTGLTTYAASVGGKYIFDGSETIKEMIKRLDSLKKQLQEYEKAGLRLQGPVEDDYACLTTTDEAVAKRLGLVLHSEDADD